MCFPYIEKFLMEYEEFQLQPIVIGEVLMLGNIKRTLHHEKYGSIDINYFLSIHIPSDYPESTPVIFETKGEINNSPSNHINYDGSFCLGSPIRLKMLLKRNPDFNYFFEMCVLPYLYAVSLKIQQQVGFLFGELAHGTDGLVQDFQELFHLDSAAKVIQMLTILSTKKRQANKMICPCGCKRRVTQCLYFKQVLLMRKLFNRCDWEEQLNYL